MDDEPLRISSPDDLLGLIPYLVGFHPELSLVLMVVGGDRIQITCRMDLGHAGPRAIASLAAGLDARFPGAVVFALVYGPNATKAWGVLDRCRRRFGSRTAMTVHVHPDGWWRDGRSRPAWPFRVETTRTAAQATVRGLVARGSRADLASLIREPAAEEVPGLEACLDAAAAEVAREPRARWPRLLSDLVARCLAATPTDAECARLVILLHEPRARDVELLALDASTAEDRVRLWSYVVRRTLPKAQFGALGFLGIAAWITGNGALASLCLERLEEVAPRCGPANVLRDLIENIVPPSAWGALVADLRAATGEHAA